jgi:uncharacterized membrane protein
VVVAGEHDALRQLAGPVRIEGVSATFTKAELGTLIGQPGTVAVQTQSFSGPMPLPEHLAQYDRIVPGAARLIVDEFQSNSKHARDIERIGLRGSIYKDVRAQFIAGILVLIGFGLVYSLAEHDHDGVAIAVAVTLLVSVLTAFLTGTVMRGKSSGHIVEIEGD